MINNSPLLSVVIPTHNRAKYAVAAIGSILSINDPRLELVVSDTSTDGELENRIADKNNTWASDRRLFYFKPQEKLDMTGNHNAAIAAAKGEFVCLIGDDDTIVADALAAAAWSRANGVDLIAPNVVANYVWPDFMSRYLGRRHASRLYISRSMGGSKIGNSAQALNMALKAAAQGTDGLPKIYHGIVKRSVLENIRKISGAYFHGSSPDVSGAIALALCSRNFLVVDYPLTIPGASGGSNTGRSAMNTHKGKMGQESQTKGFLSGGWSPGVPRFFSVETVWAHAALETIVRIAPNLKSEFNFAKLIAACRVLHSEYDAEIEQAVGEAADILGVDSLTLNETIGHEVRKFRRERLWRLLKRLSKLSVAGGRAYVPDLISVADAPTALTKHMQRLGLRWEHVIANIGTECMEPTR